MAEVAVDDRRLLKTMRWWDGFVVGLCNPGFLLVGLAGSVDTLGPKWATIIWFTSSIVGALQAYLRQSVLNRIRDEIRKVSRQPPPVELPEDEPSDRTSPLEVAIQQQTYERYRRALTTLGVRDRELIVARIEAQWSLAEIAHRFQIRTVDAARMAVTRAVQRLIKGIQSQS